MNHTPRIYSSLSVAGLFVSILLLFVLSFSLLPTPTSAAVILQAPRYIGLTDGLVGHWTFDGPTVSGTDPLKVNDLSGNGNQGSAVNADVERAIGKIGQALAFGGTADVDFVQVGTDAESLRVTDGTVSAWVFQEGSIIHGSARGDGIVHHPGHNNSDSQAYTLELQENSGNLFLKCELEINDPSLQVVVPPETNVWKHYACTWDGTTVRLYADGVEVGQTAQTGTPSYAGNGIFFIGRNRNGGKPMKGKIDDVRIYNRALTEQEIQRLHTIGAGSKLSAPRYTGSLNDGLVGYWSLDGAIPNLGTSQDYFLDESGNGHHGEPNGATELIPGKAGQAFLFDDSIDGATIPDDPALSGFSAMSLSTWFKLSSFPVSNDFWFVVAKSNGASSREYRFRLEGANGTDGLTWHISNDGEDPGTAETSHAIGNFALDTWYHAVGTYDDANNDLLELYINGELVDTATGEAGGVFDGSADLYFGRANFGASNAHLDGAVDEVRLYNRVLTPQEVKRLYEIGEAIKINTTNSAGSLADGLVGHWSFDGPEASQGYVLDESGNEKRGTLSGGPRPTIGVRGQALEFDGNDDFVDIDAAPFDFGSWQAITVAAWVKNDIGAGAGTEDIISYWNFSSGEKSWLLTHHNNDQYFWEIDGKDSVTGGTVSTNWTHVTGTYNGSAMRLYVNGVEVDSATGLSGALPAVNASVLIA